MKKILFILFSLIFSGLANAQELEAPSDTTAMRHVTLESVEVMPTSATVKGMLLLNRDIQYELEGAVDNMYNFKYEIAEKQFKSLRRRYPEHPLPYFLMGLSQWWKIVPTNIQSQHYDDLFLAYMDTTIQKAERMYDIDDTNFEAAFFLAAAHGFEGRLHSERSNWRKAAVSSKNALEYMEEAKAGNGLSPEFLFGEALFNYYSIWIHENYKMLRPILLFFPDGDKRLGLKQLRYVANSGFYSGVEAKTFLMKIYSSEPETFGEALKVAQSLATKYPDNAYFHRSYARLLFVQGHFTTAERVSEDILNKLEQHMPGYEAVSGRYASYILAYINQNKYRDFEKAKKHYQDAIMYTEMSGERESGYFIGSYLNLARIADQQDDRATAKRYYSIVLKASDKKSANYKEAKKYLSAKPKKDKKKKKAEPRKKG